MNSIIRLIINGLSYFYCPKLTTTINSFISYVRGSYYSRKVNEAGERIRVYKPKCIKGKQYINLGNNILIEEGCQIQAWDNYRGFEYHPRISIGNNVHLGLRNHISSINEITIGDDLLTGKNVLICDNLHGNTTLLELQIPPIERELFSKGPISIGSNVWIGDNVVILSNVHIGDGCVIGANSVVTKSFPNNTIIAGVPAREIKKANC